MKYKKALFNLPEPLLSDIERYAKKVTEGNKSGFVAKATTAYIDYLHRVEHTAKLRKSYKEAAAENLRIAHEWRFVDAETARMLDDDEEKGD